MMCVCACVCVSSFSKRTENKLTIVLKIFFSYSVLLQQTQHAVLLNNDLFYILKSICLFFFQSSIKFCVVIFAGFHLLACLFYLFLVSVSLSALCLSWESV